MADELRVGPIRFDTRVSLSGALAVVMAFVAVVGGWYHFNDTQQADEQRIVTLEGEHANDLVTNAHIADALSRTDGVLKEIEQALEDNKIHVRDAPP